MMNETTKGPREDSISREIDMVLAGTFSTVAVIFAERPENKRADGQSYTPPIDEARQYLMDRLKNLEISWAAPWQMKSICRPD